MTDTYSSEQEARQALNGMSRLLDAPDNSQIISDYNPYDVPGTLEDAARYKLANTFGERDPCKLDEGAFVQSANKFEKVEQGLFDSKYKETLGRFGAGYSLYFAMFIFTIILLCFPLGVAASLYMYKNSQGTDCYTGSQRTAGQEYVRTMLMKTWGPSVATQPKIEKSKAKKNLFLFEQNSALFNEHRTNDDFSDNRRRLLKKVLVDKSQINKQNKSRTRNLTSLNQAKKLKNTGKTTSKKAAPSTERSPNDQENFSELTPAQKKNLKVGRPTKDKAENKKVFVNSSAFTEWPIPLNGQASPLAVPASELTPEELDVMIKTNEKKFMTKADLKQLKVHKSTLLDCSEKIKNKTYSFRELVYCKQFEPALALNNIAKSDLIIFMHFYCKTRFLYPDPSCQLYAKLGCRFTKSFNKIMSLRTKQLFSKNRAAFNKRVKTNENIIDNQMNYSPYCQKLAFERYVLMFTGKVCVITKGIYMSQLSLGNRASNADPSAWYHYCNIFTVATYWILTQLWVIYCKTMKKHYDEQNDTPNDYAFELSGLPTGFSDKNLNMKEEIVKMFLGYGFNVAETSLIYDTTDYDEKRESLDEKRAELAKLTYKFKNKLLNYQDEGLPEKVKSLENEITTLKAECDEYENMFDSGNAGPLFLGNAIVSLETQAEKTMALEKFPKDQGLVDGLVDDAIAAVMKKEKDPLEMNIKGTKYTSLKAKACPDPADILYTNQKHGFTDKTIRHGVSQVALGQAFTACFYGVFYVFMLGQNIVNHQLEYHIVNKFLSWDWIVTKMSTIAVSVGIVVFNIVLDRVVKIVYNQRKFNYNTDLQVAIASTSFKLQFYNTTLCPVISSFISMNYLGTTGQIIQINSIFFATLVISNIKGFFDVSYYINVGFQWQFARALKNGDKSYLAGFTQKDVNLLFEGQEFDLSSKFASFFTNLGMAMHFLPILPMGVFFSIGAVIIEFWIVKWTVLKRSTSRIIVSGEIAENMKSEFDFCLVCFGVGMIFKEAILCIMNSQPIWIEKVTIIILIFALLNWLGLTNFIVNCLYGCCAGKDEVNDLAVWSTENQKWDTTYSLCNPATAVNERHRRAQPKTLEEIRRALSITRDFNMLDIFRMIDHKNIGYLTAHDLQEWSVSGPQKFKTNKNDWDNVMNAYDVDKDGKFTFSEFCVMWLPYKNSYTSILQKKSPNLCDRFAHYSVQTKKLIENALYLIIFECREDRKIQSHSAQLNQSHGKSEWGYEKKSSLLFEY